MPRSSKEKRNRKGRSTCVRRTAMPSARWTLTTRSSSCVTRSRITAYFIPSRGLRRHDLGRRTKGERETLSETTKQRAELVFGRHAHLHRELLLRRARATNRDDPPIDER